VPLAVRLTGANRNDSQEARRWLMQFPRCTANAGDRGHRPDSVLGDRRSSRRDFVVGDLEEEFATRSGDSAAASRLITCATAAKVAPVTDSAPQ
jgi:hypothetical protein